jgi:hypothetical protein
VALLVPGRVPMVGGMLVVAELVQAQALPRPARPSQAAVAVALGVRVGAAVMGLGPPLHRAILVATLLASPLVLRGQGRGRGGGGGGK